MKHALMWVFVLGLLFVAGRWNSASTQARAAEGALKLTIGVSVPAADHGWTAGIGWWARRAMAMHPDVRWVYATAVGPEKQIADTKEMMAQQRLDGLVVLAAGSAPLTPIAEEVHRNGIYLVNVDRGSLKPVADLFIESC